MAENNPYANIGTLSPDQFQKQQEATRQQRMADMLMQNNQQPQGQMIGNRFVAPSWAAQLAPVVSQLAGAYIGKNADEKALEYAKQLRAGEESAMADYLKELQGKPAVPASSVQPTIAGKPMRDDETGALYPPIVTQGTPAMPANPQRAHANAALNYNLPAFARQNAMTQLFAQPKEFDLPEGAKRYKEMPDGTIKEVASGGEKLHTVKGNLVTSSGKVVYSAPAEAGEGYGIGGSNVNNNGVRVGKYDKMGRYISPTGQNYPASAVTEAREKHDAASDLAYKLNQLTKQDVNNAYGSLTDYTTSKLGRMAGSTATVDAQTKINNIGINNTLNNLSQLKGASSDKEMAQMIKDFPGYEADPIVMSRWVERAAKTTNRFLKRSEGRFGFDTEYAQEGRFAEKPKDQKSEITPTNAPMYASNGQQRIVSLDGGKTWNPAR